MIDDTNPSTINHTQNPYYRAIARDLTAAYGLGNEDTIPLLTELTKLEGTLLRPEGDDGPKLLLELCSFVRANKEGVPNPYSEMALDIMELNCTRRRKGLEPDEIKASFLDLDIKERGREGLNRNSRSYALLRMLAAFQGTVVYGNILENPEETTRYCNLSAYYARLAGDQRRAALEDWRGAFFAIDAIVLLDEDGTLERAKNFMNDVLDPFYAAMQSALAGDTTMRNWTGANGPHRQLEKHFALGHYDGYKGAEADLALLTTSDPTAYAVYLAIHAGVFNKLQQYAADESLDPTLRALVWLRLARIARATTGQTSTYWELPQKAPAYMKRIAELETQSSPAT